MAHVQLIHTPDDKHGHSTLLVDGVDIAQKVSSRNFSITINSGGKFALQVEVNATALDVDLPDCIVTALRQPEVGA